MQSFYEDHDLEVTVSREKLEELAEPLLSTIKEHVDTITSLYSDLDYHILLIGGSTRLLCVRKLLEEYEKTINTSLVPEEAIAHGAALMASIIAQLPEHEQVNNTTSTLRQLSMRSISLQSIVPA